MHIWRGPVLSIVCPKERGPLMYNCMHKEEGYWCVLYCMYKETGPVLCIVCIKREGHCYVLYKDWCGHPVVWADISGRKYFPGNSNKWNIDSCCLKEGGPLSVVCKPLFHIRQHITNARRLVKGQQGWDWTSRIFLHVWFIFRISANILQKFLCCFRSFFTRREIRYIVE